MLIKLNTMIAAAVFCLTLFSSSVFAYSQQTLKEVNNEDITIIKTDLKRNSSLRIHRSPEMINRLRLIFSSNRKKINQ